jgi:predicted transposase/invertase (TIGR01784 family)
LFYRGETSPYPFNTDIFDCFHDKELAQEIFLKPYSLIDVTVIPDEALRTHRGIAILELIQKNIHKRDALEFIQDIVLQVAKHLLTPDQFNSLLYYISQEGESKDFKQFYSNLAEALPNYTGAIMTFAQQLKEEYKQEFMGTLAQQLKQEGCQEGRYEIAKSLLAEGWSLDLVKKVTKLPDLDLSELEKS